MAPSARDRRLALALALALLALLAPTTSASPLQRLQSSPPRHVRRQNGIDADTRIAIIIPAVVVPVVVIFIAALVYYFNHRRRRPNHRAASASRLAPGTPGGPAAGARHGPGHGRAQASQAQDGGGQLWDMLAGAGHRLFGTGRRRAGALAGRQVTASELAGLTDTTTPGTAAADNNGTSNAGGRGAANSQGTGEHGRRSGRNRRRGSMASIKTLPMYTEEVADEEMVLVKSHDPNSFSNDGSGPSSIESAASLANRASASLEGVPMLGRAAAALARAASSAGSAESDAHISSSDAGGPSSRRNSSRRASRRTSARLSGLFSAADAGSSSLDDAPEESTHDLLSAAQAVREESESSTAISDEQNDTRTRTSSFSFSSPSSSLRRSVGTGGGGEGGVRAAPTGAGDYEMIERPSLCGGDRTIDGAAGPAAGVGLEMDARAGSEMGARAGFADVSAVGVAPAPVVEQGRRDVPTEPAPSYDVAVSTPTPSDDLPAAAAATGSTLPTRANRRTGTFRSLYSTLPRLSSRLGMVAAHPQPAPSTVDEDEPSNGGAAASSPPPAATTSATLTHSRTRSGGSIFTRASQRTAGSLRSSSSNSHGPSNGNGNGGDAGTGTGTGTGTGPRAGSPLFTRTRTRSSSLASSVFHGGSVLGPSSSNASLSSFRGPISSPLQHTLVQSNYVYPRKGPTPEQMSFLSSVESLGRFGVPVGGSGSRISLVGGDESGGGSGGGSLRGRTSTDVSVRRATASPSGALLSPRTTTHSNNGPRRPDTAGSASGSGSAEGAMTGLGRTSSQFGSSFSLGHHEDGEDADGDGGDGREEDLVALPPSFEQLEEEERRGWGPRRTHAPLLLPGERDRTPVAEEDDDDVAATTAMLGGRERVDPARPEEEAGERSRSPGDDDDDGRSSRDDQRAAAPAATATATVVVEPPTPVQPSSSSFPPPLA